MAKYIPQEETYIVVQLPGEKLRAMIKRVVTEDAIIVELTSVPLAKSHTYQRGDYIACRRQKTSLGEEWEAVREQRISIEEVAEKEEKAAKVAMPKKKKSKKKKGKK